MGLVELWKGWREKVELDRRTKYEQIMDQEARQLFEAFKYIQAHTCSCGSCETTRTIEWHHYSPDELKYFHTWAVLRFTWESDDQELLDFAEVCRVKPTTWTYNRDRGILTRLKAKR